MSLHGYHISKNLVAGDPPFYSLIMAAMRKADTENLRRLKEMWPAVWEELNARYNAPFGALPEDKVTDPEDLARRIKELEAQQ